MRTLVLLLALLRRNGDFRRLFLASVVSQIGDWFAFVAVSGFVAERTGKPGLAAVVYAASVLPILFLSPLAGVFADRWDRKRLMVGADLVRVVPALAILLALHVGSPILALAGVITLSAVSAFFEPAAAAAAPNLVDAEDLPVAQAGMGSLWGTMLFVGAAVGGLVTAAIGRKASIAIDAGSFVVSAALLAQVRRPMRVGRATTATIRGHLGEVIQFIRGHHVVRALLATKLGVGIGNGIVGLLPAFAIARFGAGDAGVGALLAARGLGALLGPLVAAPFVGRDGRRLFLVCGCAILSYGAAYLFLPAAHGLVPAMACIVVAHLGGGAQWTLSTYGLQVAVPDETRGRVLSLDYGMATFAIGLSALGAGGATELLGLEATSRGLAAIALIYGIGWLFWTRRLWRGADDPLHEVAVPDRDC